MYNIIQLNDKSLSELQSIALELGIKKTESLKKEELVYKILDEQAIAGATKKVAADKLKEERNKDDKKKRSRVTVKKEDKVFSASKNGEVTKAETTTPVAKPQPKQAEPAKAANPQKEESTTETQMLEVTPYATPKTAKKKPVRSRKADETSETETAATEPATVAAQPAKESKPLAKPIPVSKAKVAVVDEESTRLLEANEPEDDFVPIEDLPSEKVELPTELFVNSNRPK